MFFPSYDVSINKGKCLRFFEETKWDWEDWLVNIQWSPIPSRPPGWYDCISDTWYFFCRKSLFTTKHKILKRQKKQKGKKRQYLKRPVLMICMKWKKATNFAEMCEVKKEKRSNIWDSILLFTEEAKIYLLSKIIFTTKHNILKTGNKRKFRQKEKKKKSWAKRWLYLFASTDESQMLFLWRFFLNCPLMFVARCSTDVCCLQVATDQDFKQTYNTLKTEVEIEIEATAKSKLKSKSRSKPETETEIEIEADWKLKSKSKLRSTTEIEIDYWKRVQNGNRLRSQKDFWKSTSSPVSRTSAPPHGELVNGRSLNCSFHRLD